MCRCLPSRWRQQQQAARILQLSLVCECCTRQTSHVLYASRVGTLLVDTPCRFSVPHVNVGDLLYQEVARKTPLGLEAQGHMDSSKAVPGRLLMQLLLERLQQPDCQVHGWVLDGFPHTRLQVGDHQRHDLHSRPGPMPFTVMVRALGF